MTDVAAKAHALNQQQRNALTKLVTNDFKTARNEVSQLAYAERQRLNTEAQAAARKNAAKAQAFNDEANKLLDEFQAEFQKLAEKARAAGVTQTYNPIRENRYGRDEYFGVKAAADQGALRQLELAERQAIAALHTAEAKAQRQILLGALSEEAVELLSEIPSAADAFTAALEATPKAELEG
jgi:hypothetical protein